MNIVGVYKDNGKVFESQSFADDNQRVQIEIAIQKDALSSGVEVETTIMTDKELESLL